LLKIAYLYLYTNNHIQQLQKVVIKKEEQNEAKQVVVPLPSFSQSPPLCPHHSSPS